MVAAGTGHYVRRYSNTRWGPVEALGLVELAVGGERSDSAHDTSSLPISLGWVDQQRKHALPTLLFITL